MYAFWRYDKYPYVLHGEVVGGPDDEGMVQVKGYATMRSDGSYGGGWFRPLLLISDTGGMELASKLDMLKVSRKEAMAKVELEYNDKLWAAAPRSLHLPKLSKP